MWFKCDQEKNWRFQRIFFKCWELSWYSIPFQLFKNCHMPNYSLFGGVPVSFLGKSVELIYSDGIMYKIFLSQFSLTIMISDEMSKCHIKNTGGSYSPQNTVNCLLFPVITIHVRSLPLLQFHPHFWNIVCSSKRFQVLLSTLMLVFILVYSVGFFYYFFNPI